MTELLNVILMMPPKEGQQGGAGMLIPMLLIFVVFYFFMIRPQVKKQKEMRTFRDNLSKGDKIITTGGIYGKIIEIKENIITIEVEDKMKLKIDKSAIVKDPSELQNQK